MVKRDLVMNSLLATLVLVIFVLLRLFVFKPYTIRQQDSNSYLAPKDKVLVSKHQEPKRGDFVLYMVDGRSHIGRIIGQEGDEVSSFEDILYLNGEAIEEPYLDQLKLDFLADPSNEAPFTEDFNLDMLGTKKDGKIPQDNYLILNDNRRQTTDSREFGLIARSKIKGVLTFRVYPVDQFGFLTVE